MKAKKEIKDYKDLREMINSVTKEYPDNVAFKIKHKVGKEVSYQEIKYSEFHNELNYLGAALIDLGFLGKRIAIIGKNSYEWGLTYISVLNGVGITVPLDKGLPTEEIESLLRRSRSNAVVFDSSYKEIMEKISKDPSNKIAEFICMDNEKESEFKTLRDLIEKGKKLIEEDKDTRYADSVIEPEKMASILFTSGTTDISKAVMLSHKNFVANINDVNNLYSFCSTDVNIAFLPFHHTFGSTGLLVMLSTGMMNVFCDGLKYIQQNLNEYKVSVFICVPLLLESIYKKIMLEIEKQGKTKMISIARKVSGILLKLGIDIRRKVFKQIIDKLGGELRLVISGAAAIDKNVAKGFYDFGILTLQGYGLTETSPIVSGEREKGIKFGSCGLPFTSIVVKIDSPNEEGVGEIAVKGANVMLGYYENQKATDEVLKDGWFYTGDLGYIDKDGYIFITGRKKNVIVLKNGKNIYPEEIELLINNLGYVAESMVYGKEKDDDLLLSVKIVYNEEYVAEKYPEISEEELKEIIWKDIKEINTHLSTYKHMKNLVITSEPMIKTTTAKIKRFEELKKEE